MWSGVEGMNNRPICDFFNRITVDLVEPLLETISVSKYVLVDIDHYSKWCEACPMKSYDVVTTIRFFEEKTIC
jgi:hypothetical protein